ncbi:AAA family ATPase [Podospora aff. communis PSN243]|uniref:AAA family ATPase n=1 Tax=Podospora aff. communis PSN243 TaxID=3040156 RepID=A0AAV9G933_9PEZI|nr:AAA family ATPase [Podospora aff. communis PSN243]
MARQSVIPAGPIGAPDEAEQQEMTGHLTEEEKARRAELEKAPMQAELKHLEKRYTKKGRAYITEPKDDDVDIGEQTNWYEKFALCVTRQYDTLNKQVQRTSVQVNSKALKNILKKVIVSYPGQIFSSADIAIDFPAHCLYHYRRELAAALDDQVLGSDGEAHLPILLNFIEEQFAEEIKDEKNLLSQGVATFAHLWTIFRPGSLIFSQRNGQPVVCKLLWYSYVCGNCPGLQLTLEYVDYDGDSFGTRNDSFKLPPYSGTTSIVQLGAFPLSYHPHAEAITNALTARGRRWEKLAGQNHMSYSGIATDTTGSRYNINSRVMIDTFTFHRIEANSAYTVQPFPNDSGVNIQGFKRKQRNEDNWNLFDVPDPTSPLTDTQALLSSPTVRGFSFTEKKFLDFFVDNLSPIAWNASCFDQLVLPQSQKELVQALVAEHTSSLPTTTTTTNGAPSAIDTTPPSLTSSPSTSSPLSPPPFTHPQKGKFDDIIKSKGLGLILVLHGPPGVGKTLTAECVSEFSHLPLYPISSGDLGTTSTLLETRLTRTLDLASTWNAILLIDEADIFLERRSLHDLERNSLVSIFLRVLEYYPGILFLTTNRITTFDDAFKSRIHVPLKYTNLSTASRLTVWRNFLAKVDGYSVSDEEMRLLSEEGRLNGRQIKNVVRTAKSLAGYKRRRLDYGQLREVMEIQMAFERDLEDVEGEE